jgi:hypothetical protein
MGMYREKIVRCLACGHLFERSLEACPRRYLSPHSAAFRKEVARLLNGKIDKENHLAAIEKAKKTMGNLA